MSLFAKVSKEDEAKLAERADHIRTYAGMLLGADYDLAPLIEKAKLDEGLSKDKLDHLQIMIEMMHERNTGPELSHVFEINSDETLDWYLKRRLELHSEYEGVKAQYDRILNRIANEEKSLAYMFQGQAEGYAQFEYERTGIKTRILPHGTVAIRTSKPSWSIEDEGRLQAWLSEMTPESKELYKVLPKTWTRDLDALKTVAENNWGKEDGITIPGLKRDPGGDKVSLRYPKE